MENEGQWYNLNGQPATLPQKGGGGSKTILVTKGIKVQR